MPSDEQQIFGIDFQTAGNFRQINERLDKFDQLIWWIVSILVAGFCVLLVTVVAVVISVILQMTGSYREYNNNLNSFDDRISSLEDSIFSVINFEIDAK